MATKRQANESGESDLSGSFPIFKVEDIKEKLKVFLENNPGSTVEKMEITSQLDDTIHEVTRITRPWSDSTISIIIFTDVDQVAEALNSVYLPERLSALWHQDTKDLEVIWTALPLSDSQKEIQGRKFVSQYLTKKYKCEFGESSERLLTISRRAFPATNPSTTNLRNLSSFSRMSRSSANGDTIEYNPRSFWIRNLRLNEKNAIKLVENLNFYLSYYDVESPTILVHDIHSPVNSKNRYIENTFPEYIVGKNLDENLVSFWDATRQQNPMLKFIFYYRIIEYASSNFFSAEVRAKISKLLANPTICTPANLDNSIKNIISAFDGYGRQTMSNGG